MDSANKPPKLPFYRAIVQPSKNVSSNVGKHYDLNKSVYYLREVYAGFNIYQMNYLAKKFLGQIGNQGHQ